MENWGAPNNSIIRKFVKGIKIMIEKLEKDDLPGINVRFSERNHRKNVLPLHDTGRKIIVSSKRSGLRPEPSLVAMTAFVL